MLRTRAGIEWVRYIVPGAAKIGGGIFAERTPGSGHTGVFGQRRLLAEMICDTMPFFPDYYRKHSTHPMPMDDVLARRARYCRPPERGGKGELVRFQQPDWAPTYRLILDSMFEHPRSLHIGELMECQEKVLVTRYTGQPGVYVNQNIQSPNQIYLGVASDLGRRPVQHTDTLMTMVGGFPTATRAMAACLESALHEKIVGLAEWRKGRTRGAYLLPREMDGLEAVRMIVDEHYRSFLHHTIRID